MVRFDETWFKGSVVQWHRERARIAGTYDGTIRTQHVVMACRGFHAPSGTVIIYTRDAGMHTSGWWKNPDYERCLHLSLSFVDPEALEPSDHDHKLAKEWIEAFFGDWKRYLWAEPPFSEPGKKTSAWHYRVFCDQHGQPILPRGEVYSLENTPAGWLSFSDLNDKVLMQLEADS